MDTAVAPPRDDATRSRRGTAVALVALALFGFLASFGARDTLFPNLSKNADEAVYLFQAQLYADGDTTLDAVHVEEGFRPWMSGPVRDRLIMVFPPGWPAALALGILAVGSAFVVQALVCAAIGPLMYLFARELVGDRAVALLAAAMASASPLVLVLGGTVLSYLFGFALGLAVGVGALRARRLERPALLAVCGVAAGALFSTRPLDAVLVSVVFGAVLLVAWRRRPALLGRGLGWAALGAVGPVVATFAYNASITGNPLRFPIEATGGNNAFGFGPRNIAPGTPVVDVSAYDMVRATVQNVLWFPLWMLGGVLVVPLAVAGFWLLWRRHRRALWISLALAALFPVAYVFYWGTLLVAVGRRDFGPHYYVPVLAPAVLAVAVAVVEVFRRRRVVGVALLGAMAVLTFGVDLPRAVELADEHNALVEPEVKALQAVEEPALVVLPRSYDGAWILHPRGYFRNTPEIDGGVVFAADTGAGNFDLGRRFPGRKLYRLFVTIPTGGRADRPEATAEPLVEVRGRGVDVRTDFVNTTGDPVVTAYLGAPSGFTRCVLDRASTKGRRYEVRWTVTGTGVVPSVDCRDRSGPDNIPEPAIGQIVVGYSAGADAEWFGVDRYEYLLSARQDRDGVALMTPGDQRRGYAKPPPDRPSVFIGQCDDVVGIDVARAG